MKRASSHGHGVSPSLIDARKTALPGCKNCANREERGQNSDEGICKNNTSSLDGLPIRCVGTWANEKIHYLVRYFDIFAKGMHSKWRKVRYIEVCSGPGRCSTRDRYEQDGTALAVINHSSFQYVENAIFIDYNTVAINALNQRIFNAGLSGKAQAVLGDYNRPELLSEFLRKQPFDGLTLCLVDPTSCDIPFKTIEVLAKDGGAKTDFIISFFSESDFRRNGVGATLRPEFSEARAKYLRFLGDDRFFDEDAVKNAALANNHEALLQLFITA